MKLQDLVHSHGSQNNSVHDNTILHRLWQPVPPSSTISSCEKLSANAKKKLDDRLNDLFTVYLQSFSVVEDRGLKNFAQTKSILSATRPAHNFKKRPYQQCTKNAYVAITGHFINTDFHMQSVLYECCCLGKSHTEKNLAEELKRVVAKWSIEGKVVLVVTDNANNIKQYVALTKEIYAYYQQKLLQNVPTRWNSTFYMLKSFIELRAAVRSSIDLIDKDLPVLKAEEL
ncbi:hypothetical protein PR048_027183 [Dryococelus australis]|uniref:DUF659 domain-containing protein n=1 Tax=Dryococelus australis TaxID=614101 RepID=A0ABQ9GG79_9NEOP|nr:hypothetical protein PR048_027183 [Dryococelus australis]